MDAKRRDDFAYELGLRLFLFYSDKAHKEDHYTEFGFGRKQLKRMRKDIADSQESLPVGALSNEGLVLSLLWDSNKNRFQELAQESRRRGLIVCMGQG